MPTSINNRVYRPVLRWHGGKWRLAPWIISHFPEHRIYCEPYGGAASVLMRKSRVDHETYNDLDGEVVNLFRVIRDQHAELRRLLAATPFSREEFCMSYQPSDDPLERARRLVIRSFQGFGSNGHHRTTGFRAMSLRKGNPAQTDWMHFPSHLDAMAWRLQGVVIECRPAVEVMLRLDRPDALHYIDPPYVPATRDSGSDYSHEMTDADHQEMLAVLRELKGAVVLSGYPNPMYDKTLSGWQTVDRIAIADGARRRTERLWLHNVQLQPTLALMQEDR